MPRMSEAIIRLLHQVTLLPDGVMDEQNSKIEHGQIPAIMVLFLILVRFQWGRSGMERQIPISLGKNTPVLTTMKTQQVTMIMGFMPDRILTIREVAEP